MNELFSDYFIGIKRSSSSSLSNYIKSIDQFYSPEDRFSVKEACFKYEIK